MNEPKLDELLADMTELPVLQDEDVYYEWNEFRAYYDPKARIFYWGSDSGCSCNYFWDGFYNLGDFENGGKDSLIAAAKRWQDTRWDKDESVISQQMTRFLDAVRAVK